MLTTTSVSADQRTAIYMRVSTKEQKVDGYGLESQHKALLHYTKANAQTNYITKKEWEFTDVHTGSDIKRSGLQTLLTCIKKGEIDTVVVWKIDRLSRSMKHLLIIFETFKKYKVNFISVQENMNFNGAVGNFIFNILSSVAELERSLIKVRTRAGILASAEMGNFTGTSVPYGYRTVKNTDGRGKRLEIIPEEKKVVEQIFSWYIYGERGFLAISNILNEKNVPLGIHAKSRSKTKTKWTPRHVEKIIKRPIYRGEYIANRKDENGIVLPQEQWTIVSIPPCIDELTFAMAERKRTERKGSRQSTGNIYLLSGKLVDISTPKRYKFTGFPRTKGGYSYRRKPHVDQYGTKHGVFEFPAAAAEEVVWEKIMLALTEPEKFIRLHKNQLHSSRETENIRKRLHQLREQKANLQLEHGRIERAYESGFYTLDKAEQKTSELEQKEDQLVAEILDTEESLNQVALQREEIESLKKAAKNLDYNLENLDRAQKRMFIDLFVDYVEVDRKPIGVTPSGKRTRWERSLEVFFRFHPELDESKKGKGRTKKPHENGVDGNFDDDNVSFGGRSIRGWYQFRAKYIFTKKYLGSNIFGQYVALKEIPNHHEN